jgi:hypothetical protein
MRNLWKIHDCRGCTVQSRLASLVWVRFAICERLTSVRLCEPWLRIYGSQVGAMSVMILREAGPVVIHRRECPVLFFSLYPRTNFCSRARMSFLALSNAWRSCGERLDFSVRTRFVRECLIMFYFLVDTDANFLHVRGSDPVVAGPNFLLTCERSRVPYSLYRSIVLLARECLIRFYFALLPLCPLFLHPAAADLVVSNSPIFLLARTSRSLFSANSALFRNGGLHFSSRPTFD